MTTADRPKEEGGEQEEGSRMRRLDLRLGTIGGVGLRKLTRAVVISGVLFVAITAQVQAATTVGQTFVPSVGCGDGYTFLQSSSPGAQYAVPTPGVITAWSHEAPPTDAHTSAKLKVGRLAAANTFTIVGDSPLKPIVAGQLNTFTDVSIPVQAGDVIGIFFGPIADMEPTKLCARAVPEPGWTIHLQLGDLPPGSTTEFLPPEPGGALDVSARLEPDCDNDGFGDETQDTDTLSCNPINCGGKVSTLVGTEGNDTLVGTPASDVIAALGGEDTVKGLSGKDRICGGTGKDTLKGGGGADKLKGGASSDVLKGGGGTDKCVGGTGGDTAGKCEVERSI
jgi:hypothetical protein